MRLAMALAAIASLAAPTASYAEDARVCGFYFDGDRDKLIADIGRTCRPDDVVSLGFQDVVPFAVVTAICRFDRQITIQRSVLACVYRGSSRTAISTR